MAHLTTREGVRLYYEHHRPAASAAGAALTGGSAADRPTVIFSCAYTTTHENWRDQVAPLVAAGHPVVLWDLRAHGDSEAPSGGEAWSIEDVVAVTGLRGSFDGLDLGTLADVDPPCRFGFSSVPRRPSVTRVVTTVDVHG